MNFRILFVVGLLGLLGVLQTQSSSFAQEVDRKSLREALAFTLPSMDQPMRWFNGAMDASTRPNRLLARSGHWASNVPMFRSSKEREFGETAFDLRTNPQRSSATKVRYYLDTSKRSQARWVFGCDSTRTRT